MPQTKRTEELQPGDVVIIDGHRYTVRNMEDYTSPSGSPGTGKLINWSAHPEGTNDGLYADTNWEWQLA